MGIRTVLYARISSDATGQEAGVNRQLKDCRALAKLRGLNVVAELSDNDISALRGKHRPGYAELMKMVRGREIDRVVAWQQSRLWRNRVERAQAIEELREAGVGLVYVRGPELDLSTAYGRGMAAMMGEQDTLESEIKSERVLRVVEERVELGRANGPVAYGWKRERVIDTQGRLIDWQDVLDEEDTVDPETGEVHRATAPVVRRIVDDLDDGVPLLVIARRLNEEGFPAPGAHLNIPRGSLNPDGRQWTRTAVARVATRPANIGLRVHHKGRPDERTVPAAWPAIVEDEDKWTRVRDKLAEKAKGKREDRPAARRHLLTVGKGHDQIAVCGVCGEGLRVARRGRRRREVYACMAKSMCVGRDVAYVDRMVRDLVVERLSRPDAADLFNDGEEAEAALQARARADGIQAQMNVAADRFVEGKWTADQVDRINAQLMPEWEKADAEARRLERAAHAGRQQRLAAWVGPKALGKWEAAEPAQRRELLEDLGVRVVIKPIGRRGPGFDPSSVGLSFLKPTEKPHEPETGFH